MKMQKIILLAIMSIATLGAKHAYAMSISEVAELQFHTVDQLAARNKIDKGFVDHLESVQLEKKANSANYLVTFSQETNTNQIASSVTIEATDAAKPVDFSQTTGSSSANPVNWEGKAPLDILEKAVEYVVDTNTDPRLVPFQNGFTKASIAPLKSDAGLNAIVKVSAGAQDGNIILQLDLSGKVISVSKE